MNTFPVYNISQFQKKQPDKHLYCNRFKNHLQKHPFIEKPHRHDFHLVVVFTKGSGLHVVDFQSYTIKPGSVFVLQPGQMHHWELSKDIDGYILFHSKELYNLHFRQKSINDYPFYFSGYNTPELQVNTDELSVIVNLFEMILEEYTSTNLLKEHSILNILDLMYIHLSRNYITSKHKSSNRYTNLLQQFEKIVESKYREEKKPSFYADALHITVKHLNRICKITLQKTATTIITDRIILESKRMLLNPKLTVNEIANYLGYEDYSYFSRLFKQRTELTPTEFRKQLHT